MIFIYLFTANRFPPYGSSQQSCTKIGKRQLYTKEEIINKKYKNHRIHNIQNKTTNIKGILNNISINYFLSKLCSVSGTVNFLKYN